MSISRRGLLVAGVALVAAAGGAAFWMSGPEQLEAHAFYAVDGVAIRGTDPVAYFTEGAAVAGSAEFSHEWSGATWHFASADNRDAFAAEPTAYAPQFGGFCAWAVAEKGELYSTQPDNWAVVDGKLYLNFNDDIQERWNADRPGFISEGDRRWPELRADAEET